MNMLEYLEKDKEKFLADLTAAKSPENAKITVENEIDRLLLLYNEHCDMTERREAAAYMMQTARMSAPLICTVGESRVWAEMQTKNGRKDGGKLPMSAKLLTGGAGICGICAFVLPLVLRSQSLRVTDILLILLLAAAAPVLGFLGGRKAGSVRPVIGKDKSVYHVEYDVDAGKIYSAVRNLLLAVDQNLDTIYPQEPVTGEAAAGKDLSKADIDLFAGLLEAAGSGDGDYALERLADLRFYLHRKNIETADYNGDNKEMFDLMPAAEKRTYRPAMLSEGHVLKKGLASEGRL